MVDTVSGNETEHSWADYQRDLTYRKLLSNFHTGHSVGVKEVVRTPFLQAVVSWRSR